MNFAISGSTVNISVEGCSNRCPYCSATYGVIAYFLAGAHAASAPISNRISCKIEVSEKLLGYTNFTVCPSFESI